MGVLARNSFSALKKKLTVNFFQKCTQLKLAPVPGSARNLRKSYRGIFEKTPYMYSMGVLADTIFSMEFEMCFSNVLVWHQKSMIFSVVWGYGTSPPVERQQRNRPGRVVHVFEDWAPQKDFIPVLCITVYVILHITVCNPVFPVF